jgi:hypothetical protein
MPFIPAPKSAVAEPIIRPAVLDVLMTETKRKVLSEFEGKEKAISVGGILRIQNIRKADLVRFCKEVLGRDDIEVKELPSKKGCFFTLDKRAFEALDIIKEEKGRAK